MLSTAQQTVLIIDDDPNNLKVVVEYIKAYNYRILIARDGETGLKRARLGDPDLILLDVVMPGIDGFETCRRLAADPSTRDIPVIFMTGRTEVEDKIRGFEVGSVDYVTKPVEKRELLARVQAHLRIRLQQSQLESYAELLQSQVSDKAQLAEQEKVQREHLNKELERLQKLLSEQGEHIQGLTRQWLRHRGEKAEGWEPRAGLTLDLALGHLKQAQGILGSDRAPSAHVLDALRHLAIVTELCTAIHDASGEPQARPPAPTEPDPFEQLSDREREIVVLMVSGHANKEIAYELGIAPTTVSTHRKRILERLEVGDLPSLVKLALKFGVMS